MAAVGLLSMPPVRSCSSGLSREGRALAFAHSIDDLAEPPELRVVPISCTEVFAFGRRSVLSPDEEEHPFTIDGREYRSVFDFYRRKMCDELSDGRLSSEREQDADWRSLLLHEGVSQQSFDWWFLQRGLLYLQQAILQRALEHKRIRDALMAVGNRYVLYTDKGDRFYGTGQDIRSSLRKWEAEQPFNVCAMVPVEFPLTAASLPFLLNLWAGRNVLGTILMRAVGLVVPADRRVAVRSAPRRRLRAARSPPLGPLRPVRLDEAGGRLEDVDVRRFTNPPRAIATPPPPRPKTPTPPKGAGRRRSSPHWNDGVEIREHSVARNNRPLPPPCRFDREGAPSPPSPRSRL
ncbi:hypothetical protein M3Y99_01616900 [Aphelenchoides fujianensis]|nr:hypothetical protein M3Y99_01616900 [Aphelenchoides fujianensis]